MVCLTLILDGVFSLAIRHFFANPVFKFLISSLITAHSIPNPFVPCVLLKSTPSVDPPNEKSLRFLLTASTPSKRN